tara:strand:- start:214 stop:534 length:321 start_codon:yes stop_codon:yes gene_type:complete
MVLVTPFSTYLSSDNYIQMNESFINISFTPAEVLFIGVVALFIFIIFGGRNDDEDSDNGDSLNAIKPIVSKFESDEDLGQYVRALANANQASTKRNTSQKKPSKSK